MDSVSHTEKRQREDDLDNEVVQKMKASDKSVLKEMQFKLNEADAEINADIERTRQKYYVSYFKRVLKELPACQNIMDLDEIPETSEGFYKTFSIAKTCVSSHLQLKKIMAFNSIFDMITGVVGKFVHDKFVTPSLKQFLSESALKNAFSKYQETLSSDDAEKSSELHCIAYLIQIEIERKEPLKISNPIFNRFTQQITAVSKYITEIIKEITSQPIQQ